MKSRVAATFVFCVGAVSVFAFDGDEHSQISTIALKTALRMSNQPGVVDVVNDALNGPPSFGHITEAVDWFQCPDDFLKFETKQESGPETGIESAINRRNRKTSFIQKGLAAHYNTAHFQDGALEAWRNYHNQALDFARDGNLHRALLREAVALHYLQDFLAAGHVVTPRAGMHDAVAGHLHDRYNQEGVEFRLSDPIPSDVLAALVDVDNGLNPREREEYWAALADTKPVVFHGDGGLKSKKNPAQKTFVAAISALSVAQLFHANRRLEPCFEMRSAKQGKYGEPIDLKGPKAGIRAVNGSEYEHVALAPACGGTRESLGQYEAPNFGDGPNDAYYHPMGVTLRGEVAYAAHSRGLRTNLDALLFILATDPRGRLKNEDSSEGFKNRNVLSVGSVGTSISHGSGYRAVGLLYDFYHPGPERWRSIAWGFRVAPRRYSYADTHHWKLDTGLKATFGLDVVSIGAAIERARHFDTLGRFRPTYFVTLGVETSLNPFWIKPKH